MWEKRQVPWPCSLLCDLQETGGSSATSISIFTTDISHESVESDILLVSQLQLPPEPVLVYLSVTWSWRKMYMVVSMTLLQYVLTTKVYAVVSVPLSQSAQSCTRLLVCHYNYYTICSKMYTVDSVPLSQSALRCTWLLVWHYYNNVCITVCS